MQQRKLATKTDFNIRLCGKCNHIKEKFIRRHYNEHANTWQLLPLSFIYLCTNPECDGRVDISKLLTWKRVTESNPL